MLLGEKRIADANRMFLVLFHGQTRQRDELDRAGGQKPKYPVHWWFALPRSTLGSWRLKGYRVFEETKAYCEVRRGFYIHAFSTKRTGEVVCLEKVFAKAETHLGKTSDL